MKGIRTSPGIAIGRALLKEESIIDINDHLIQDPKKEIERLESALEKSIKEVMELYHRTSKEVGKEEAEIFNAHKMMLEDIEFIGKIKEKINGKKINAEWATKETADTFIATFESIEDEYLKERALDLKDVSNRLLRNLLGIEDIDLSNLKEESIIVAEDLTPSDTAQMDKGKVLGFVTELGGPTSHTSIIARSLEIPAIAGVKNVMENIKMGDFLIIDGNDGRIIVNPTEEEINIYKNKKKRIEEFKEKLQSIKGEKTISKDGVEVEIAGNIGGPKDVDNVLENDGEGIGLYRTEFLFMDRDRMPSEEEQFEAYKEVAEKMDGKPVIIRTLDVGGDKDIPYMNMPEEMNPFLGYRAIRLSLDRPEVFEIQLKAILRASAYGNIKIMFPMISTINEIRESKKIVEKAKEDLKKENIPFDENIELGIMVEIPAVAVQGDRFAKEVDFFSIGTNDLIQYTTAVDRGNQTISHLYSQYHPAVLRLIKMTIDFGHKEGIWVGMCGEAAGDEKLIPILLGMGLDEFSMSPSSMLRSRWIINNMSKKELEPIVDRVLDMDTAEEVEQFLDEEVAFKF